MKLPNLTPNDVRGRKLANGQRRILWAIVDVWLRQMSAAGDLSKLASLLGIAATLLTRRRQRLGLQGLPRGRPKALELAPMEAEVHAALTAGLSTSQIAQAREVSTQSISRAKARIKEKLSYWETRCSICKGTGVESCTSCGMIPSHNHVCSRCGGVGSETRC